MTKYTIQWKSKGMEWVNIKGYSGITKADAFESAYRLRKKYTLCKVRVVVSI